MSWLRVFILALTIDIVWVWCVAAVAAKRPVSAALASGVLTYVSASMTLAYVGEPRLRWAAVCGALLGSYAVVSWARSKP